MTEVSETPSQGTLILPHSFADIQQDLTAKPVKSTQNLRTIYC